jgi:hypothetical protein
MFSVIITHAHGPVINQAVFDTLQEARQYFNQLVREKPFEQVLIRLIETRNYCQSFLLDTIRVGSVLPRRKRANSSAYVVTNPHQERTKKPERKKFPPRVHIKFIHV